MTSPDSLLGLVTLTPPPCGAYFFRPCAAPSYFIELSKNFLLPLLLCRCSTHVFCRDGLETFPSFTEPTEPSHYRPLFSTKARALADVIRSNKRAPQMQMVEKSNLKVQKPPECGLLIVDKTTGLVLFIRQSHWPNGSCSASWRGRLRLFKHCPEETCKRRTCLQNQTRQGAPQRLNLNGRSIGPRDILRVHKVGGPIVFRGSFTATKLGMQKKNPCFGSKNRLPQNCPGGLCRKPKGNQQADQNHGEAPDCSSQ